jgi:hypothetical protein
MGTDGADDEELPKRWVVAIMLACAYAVIGYLLFFHGV